MAPDAAGPSVKSSGITSGRLQSSHRSGTPLSSKIAASSITSSPVKSRGTPRSRRHTIPPDRDSDSSLSDADNLDSEAETERLHISPQKQRPKMMVQHLGSSSTTTTVEMPPVKGGSGADDIPDEQFTIPGSPSVRSSSKKRKRDTNESPSRRSEDPDNKPVTVSPPKKKAHVPKNQKNTSEAEKSEHEEQEPVVNGDDRPSEVEINGKEDGNNDGETMSEKAPEQPGTPQVEDVDEDATLIEDDTADAGGLDDEDAERAIQKKKAMEDLAEIERVFAKLKDSIYNEKLRRVEIEMKLLMEGQHPEYVAQKVCIDKRLEEKVRLANAQFKYAMESLDTATRVNRAQIHSQYFQQTRKIREDVLYECSELWYHIQRERRAGDSLVPEYTFRIPDRQSTRIKQRMQYNWEVEILSAVQKHIGFPAAPDICGATEEEKEDDLEKLGIAPRASSAVRPVAPFGIMRLDDQLDRTSPHHWSPVHPSPTSPVTHASQQPHAHPTHVHRHHHHHHKRQHPSEQTSFGSRRAPGASSIGPQPSSLSLSSMLQQSSSGPVKMEPQSSSQGAMPAPRHMESFAAFQSSGPQRQSSFGSMNLQSYPQHGTSGGARLSDPSPVDIRREQEMESFRRAKELAGGMSIAEGAEGGLRGPMSFRPGGKGYA